MRREPISVCYSGRTGDLRLAERPSGQMQLSSVACFGAWRVGREPTGLTGPAGIAPGPSCSLARPVRKASKVCRASRVSPAPGRLGRAAGRRGPPRVLRSEPPVPLVPPVPDGPAGPGWSDRRGWTVPAGPAGPNGADGPSRPGGPTVRWTPQAQPVHRCRWSSRPGSGPDPGADPTRRLSRPLLVLTGPAGPAASQVKLGSAVLAGGNDAAGTPFGPSTASPARLARLPWAAARSWQNGSNAKAAVYLSAPTPRTDGVTPKLDGKHRASSRSRTANGQSPTIQAFVICSN